MIGPIPVFSVFGFLLGLAIVDMGMRNQEMKNDSPTAKVVVSAVIIICTTVGGYIVGLVLNFVINLVTKFFGV